MNLGELQAELRHFAAERDWQPFHTPKNLSTALMVEAAELAEIFQWQTPEESRQVPQRAELRQQVGEELADVLLYLLQLADHCQVHLPLAVHDKLAKNAQKYPAKQQIARPQPPLAAAPGVHVLLDFENVQPTDAQLRALVPQAGRVWVFHGPHQRQVARRFASFGQQVTAVPISQTGKNALDFHLSFYMGLIASRNREASMVVVANDKGYEPMLEHARTMGFVVRRQPFPAEPAPAAKAASKKAASKKVAAQKTTAKKTPVKKAPAAAPVPTSAPAAAPTQAKSRPAKPAAPAKAARKTTAPKAAPTRPAPVPQAPAAPVQAPQPVARKASDKPAPARQALAKKTALPQQARAAATVPAAPTASPKPARAPKGPVAKPSPVQPGAVSAKDLQRITEQLHKTGAKRPTKLGRLRGLLKSLLSAQTGDAVIEQAIQKLIAAGTVSVSANNDIGYPRFQADAAPAAR